MSLPMPAYTSTGALSDVRPRAFEDRTCDALAPSGAIFNSLVTTLIYDVAKNGSNVNDGGSSVMRRSDKGKFLLSRWERVHHYGLQILLFIPSLSAAGTRVSEEIWAALNIEVLRADEGEARNARVGVTGDPRENPPTSGFVRHDSHMRESGSDPAGNRTRFALMGGEKSAPEVRNFTHLTAHQIAYPEGAPWAGGGGGRASTQDKINSRYVDTTSSYLFVDACQTKCTMGDWQLASKGCQKGGGSQGARCVRNIHEGRRDRVGNCVRARETRRGSQGVRRRASFPLPLGRLAVEGPVFLNNTLTLSARGGKRGEEVDYHGSRPWSSEDRGDLPTPPPPLQPVRGTMSAPDAQRIRKRKRMRERVKLFVGGSVANIKRENSTKSQGKIYQNPLDYKKPHPVHNNT
ncbi:hypothetical protein PR048_010412 [Dryococelus australis]|uniref:Uncharacterized protein n=1 Tax=Dryococelus australis TaxID=614101 RepID=A0ABQ9I4M6_9NEOP|nr:hypothetical protein PR048_010412 [Dryococelus australis]